MVGSFIAQVAVLRLKTSAASPTIKPFANVVADYTCYDRLKEIEYFRH